MVPSDPGRKNIAYFMDLNKEWLIKRLFKEVDAGLRELARVVKHQEILIEENHYHHQDFEGYGKEAVIRTQYKL